jgi:LPXTG-motif cell wall-anchored protein
VVTHGFPNLTYKDTLSMKSDPEITVYHDRVTANAGTGNLIPMVAIGAIAAVAAIGAVVFMRKRKKNRQK